MIPLLIDHAHFGLRLLMNHKCVGEVKFSFMVAIVVHHTIQQRHQAQDVQLGNHNLIKI